MRRIKIAGVCLFALCAIGALAAVNASAKLPEWGQCEALAGGKYEDAACTVHAGHRKTNGHYEWYSQEAFDKGHGDNGYNLEAKVGATTFETTSGKKVECREGEPAEGYNDLQLEGANKVKEVLLYLVGCKSEGEACHSPGFGETEEEEEGNGGVVTNFDSWLEGEGLRGGLVFVGGKGTAEPSIGLELTAYNDKSENVEQKRLLTAICNGAIGTVWVGGEIKGKNGGNEVISLITPVNEMTSAFTQTFAGTSGVQEPSALENGRLQTLQEFVGSRWERAAVSSTFADTAEAALEIKATK